MSKIEKLNRKYITNNTSVNVVNIFDPFTFKLNHISIDIKFSEQDLNGGEDYVNEKIDEISLHIKKELKKSIKDNL